VCVVAVRLVIYGYGVLYRSVCVGTGGLCSPGCGRSVCSGGSWWRFRVLGVVSVCDQVSAATQTSNAPDDGRMNLKHVELRIHQ